MNRKVINGLFAVISVVAATTMIATTSIAETPKTDTEQGNSQAIHPYGMPGGMMGYGGWDMEQ